MRFHQLLLKITRELLDFLVLDLDIDTIWDEISVADVLERTNIYRSFIFNVIMQ